MQSNSCQPQRAIILADETADWKIAGLRQIDRLTLALQRELGISRAHITISAVGAVSDLDSLGSEKFLVLSTRVVPGRRALRQDGFPALTVEPAEFANALTRLQTVARSSDPAAPDWTYLAEESDIPRAAKKLFSLTSKPQDGVVSRFLNRPLSRVLSRLLVRTPILPNQLTLLLMALPLAGACFLLRGDYIGFALGAIFFQLHSALDGCDGEIARVKYLESTAGQKLDEVCDRLSTLLFAVALGFGLSHQAGVDDALRWTYLAEGMCAALFIGVAETFLTRHRIEEEETPGAYGSYLRAHRESFNQGDQLKLWLIKRAGLLSLGESATSLFGQLTKRDVFNFTFMLLALCGLASWVLHILALCACAILLLALKELIAPTLDANSAA